MRLARSVVIAKERLGEAAFQSAPRRGMLWEEGSKWTWIRR